MKSYFSSLLFYFISFLHPCLSSFSSSDISVAGSVCLGVQIHIYGFILFLKCNRFLLATPPGPPGPRPPRGPRSGWKRPWTRPLTLRPDSQSSDNPHLVTSGPSVELIGVNQFHPCRMCAHMRAPALNNSRTQWETFFSFFFFFCLQLDVCQKSPSLSFSLSLSDGFGPPSLPLSSSPPLLPLFLSSSSCWSGSRRVSAARSSSPKKNPTESHLPRERRTFWTFWTFWTLRAVGQEPNTRPAAPPSAVETVDAEVTRVWMSLDSFFFF